MVSASRHRVFWATTHKRRVPRASDFPNMPWRLPEYLAREGHTGIHDHCEVARLWNSWCDALLLDPEASRKGLWLEVPATPTTTWGIGCLFCLVLVHGGRDAKSLWAKTAVGGDG
jgi:hypothetical protein